MNHSFNVIDSRYRYTMAHIWACPPSEGDDYIFHCHPDDQKIPKPKRLQEWYRKMLEKGIIERIVLDFKVRFEEVDIEIENFFTTCYNITYFFFLGYIKTSYGG